MKKWLIVFSVIALVMLIYVNQVRIWEVYMRIDTHFDPSEAPTKPDYQLESNWAALPTRMDQADVLPPDSNLQDEQLNALADVFFVHPTSAVVSRNIHASTNDWITNYVTDHGSISQHASLFNGAGKIYAPRYREITMAAQRSGISGEDKQRARELSYSDIKTAFEYYMKHYNQGRPVILASHSQGTWYTPDLINTFFAKGKPYEKQLVVAYLVGGNLTESRMKDIDLPLCSSPEQVGCYVAWDSVLENSELASRQIDTEVGKNICVNPLSWHIDNIKQDRSYNSGSLPMIDAFGLKPLDRKLFSAQCGENGLLQVNDTNHPGFQKVRFDGGSMHTYDYGMFYMSVRENAGVRVKRFLK